MTDYNNWKNCRKRTEDVQAFCFQWTGDPKDFSTVGDVVKTVVRGSWCGCKQPPPCDAASDSDVDLLIRTDPDIQNGGCMFTYNPGDWICIRNGAVGLVSAADFREEWEVCDVVCDDDGIPL